MSMTPEERARRKRMKTFQDELDRTDSGGMMKFVIWLLILFVFIIAVSPGH